jgi:hypothetical protein
MRIIAEAIVPTQSSNSRISRRRTYNPATYG